MSVSGRIRDIATIRRYVSRVRERLGAPSAGTGIAAMWVLSLIIVAIGYGVDPDAGWLSRSVARLHPVVVHLPIGFLVGAALFELASWIRREEAFQRAGLVLLGAGAVSAAVAVAAGFLLSRQGSYDEILLDRHQALGIGVLVLALGSLTLGGMLRRRSTGWNGAYAGSLLLVFLFVIAAGHFGGTLTHGPEYLTEQLPGPLRSMLGLGATAAMTGTADADPSHAQVYQHLVAPALAQRCVTCHGPAKQDGDLRLDTHAGMLAGGEGGPAIAPGKASASELVRRISLPAHHEDHMPPSGRRPLTIAEADLIRLWIDAGADTTTRVSDLIFPESMGALMEAFGIDPLQPRTGIFALDVPPPDSQAISDAVAAGWKIAPLSERVVFLDVRPGISPAEIDDATLEVLAPLAPNVAWLDLRRTAITDASADRIASFSNVVRLRLDQTGVTERTVASLAALDHLTYLNLVGSRVGDGAVEELARMKPLKSVYLWQTQASASAVELLRQRRTDLAVVSGP